MNTILGRFSVIATVVLLFCTLAASTAPSTDGSVEFLRAPNGGIQPRAAVDDNGTIHLLYFEGQGGSGDLFYVTRTGVDSAWPRPFRVNSEEGG